MVWKIPILALQKREASLPLSKLWRVQCRCQVMSLLGGSSHLVKWFITMVIVSPQFLGFWDPFQMAYINGLQIGLTNHLQVLGWSSKCPPFQPLICPATIEFIIQVASPELGVQNAGVLNPTPPIMTYRNPLENIAGLSSHSNPFQPFQNHLYLYSRL